MDTKVLGARIQFYREQVDMTQTDLAERIGCTPQHISAIERGVKTPRLETFVTIFQTLNIPPNLLLCDWTADLDEMWEAEVDAALQVLSSKRRAFVKHKLTLNLLEPLGQKKLSG